VHLRTHPALLRHDVSLVHRHPRDFLPFIAEK